MLNEAKAKEKIGDYIIDTLDRLNILEQNTYDRAINFARNILASSGSHHWSLYRLIFTSIYPITTKKGISDLDKIREVVNFVSTHEPDTVKHYNIVVAE